MKGKGWRGEKEKEGGERKVRYQTKMASMLQNHRIEKDRSWAEGANEKLEKRKRGRENGRWRVRICARGPAVAQPRATIREPRPSSRLTGGTAPSASSAAPAPPPQPSRRPSRDHSPCGGKRWRNQQNAERMRMRGAKGLEMEQIKGMEHKWRGWGLHK